MSALPVPPIAELIAPAGWRAVDCVSDLHLEPGTPQTLAALLAHLRTTDADAVFILGDLFEVWVGDDALEDAGSFEAQCCELLADAARLRPTYFMHGNRDFLVGPAFAQRTGIELLADPTALQLAGRRWLLTHGDALCLDDTDYLAFRAMVRSAEWQRSFLAQPLAQREAVARDLRERSEARKKSLAHDPALWADVDAEEARRWLRAAGAATLIHGHTHRPATHDLGEGLQRVVLSDWDAAATPARLDILRLSHSGFSHLRP